jgi:hypothetical protein
VVEGDTIGVVQFRIEGEFYNAYYALPNKEPVFLGGIATMFVGDDPGGPYRRIRFMSLMQDSVSHVLMTRFGIEVAHGAPVAVGETKRITDADA